MPARSVSRTLLFIVCLTAFSSCNTAPTAGAGKRYMVTSPRTQFYKYGPAQAFGADLVLQHGQKVIMIETSFGYSKVMTEEGMAGYVASDEIGLAPPEPPPPKATPAPKSSRSVASGKPRRSDVQSTPGSPLFDVSDVPPPPLPENPEPEPAPKLRF